MAVIKKKDENITNVEEHRKHLLIGGTVDQGSSFGK